MIFIFIFSIYFLCFFKTFLLFFKFQKKRKKNFWPQKKDIGSFLSYSLAADFVDTLLMELGSGCHIQKSFANSLFLLEKNHFKNEAMKVNLAMKLGYSFREAILEIKRTTSNQALQELLENLSISLKLGTSVQRILEQMSLHFRSKARNQLEELTAKAPIKMIFPLVTFIFPVIFILIGAGAIHNFLRHFPQ